MANEPTKSDSGNGEGEYTEAYVKELPRAALAVVRRFARLAGHQGGAAPTARFAVIELARLIETGEYPIVRKTDD